MELKSTEANVVITIEHDTGTVQVFPFWECDLKPAELSQMAAQYALDLCERLGNGSAVGYVQMKP